jgi:hypothetical protein
LTEQIRADVEPFKGPQYAEPPLHDSQNGNENQYRRCEASWFHPLNL